MATEDDLTLGGVHTMKYTEHVSEECTLENYILINQCHLNKSNEKKKEKIIKNVQYREYS